MPEVIKTATHYLLPVDHPDADAVLRCICSARRVEGLMVAVPAEEFEAWQPPEPGYPSWWHHRTQPYQHQQQAFDYLKDACRGALLGEQGTGKTKVLLDVAAYKLQRLQITGAVVVTKKGVHRQWAEEQIPKHWPQGVPVTPIVWRGKELRRDDITRPGAVLCINVDALITQRGRKQLQRFINAHSERIMVIYDESHLLKNPRSKRNRTAREIFKRVPYRFIATGTPITRTAEDIYGQFLLLGRDIIGHKTLTSFRAEFCIMGGPDGRWVVGSRNLDRLNKRIRPWTFRMRKEILDLPPKVYDTAAYELPAVLRKHYDELRHLMLTQIENGEIVTVQHALTQIVRLQQVVHGWLQTDESIHDIAPGARIEVVQDILEQRDGPAIVWCTFRHDAELLLKHLPAAVRYIGGDSVDAIEAWKAGHARVLITTYGAGATGLNLQGDCRTIIYYGHTFKAGDRWQSEDRVHRIGTQASVTYFDIVALDTLDQRILQLIRRKTKEANIIMDDIRRLIE